MDFETWIAGEMDRGLSQLEVYQMRAAWGAATMAEREACAKVCDAEAAAWKKPKYSFASAAGEHCARAIRMRSNAKDQPGRTG